MAVQYTSISINESEPIKNLTLFNIVAVDNHQLAQIIRKLGNACCRKAHFCIGCNYFPTFTLLSGMFPSPYILQAHNVFLMACVLILIVDAIQ